MLVEFTTTVDITNSNITRNFKSQGSPLSQDEWDFLRNEQRNWEVVIQLLSLRFNPEKISKPIKTIDNDNQNIWKFTCEYNNEFDINLLKEDFNNIPIISKLEETTAPDKSCFITEIENANLFIK